jgi:hypothetical protein
LASVRARRWLPAAMAATHLGILLAQNVAFLELVLLQAVFYDWRWRLSARRRGLAGPRRETLPAAVPDPRDPVRPARRLAAVFLLAWALRLELYPLSAMQMYAGRTTSGEVEYLRVTAERRSGERVPAPLEEAIPALADARYRWVLAGFFGGSADERRLAADYLVAVARAHNRRAPEEEEIVAFAVEKFRWSFLAHPEQAPEPTPGERIGRRRVRVAEPRPHRPPG